MALLSTPMWQSPLRADHVLLSFELCFQAMQLISGEYRSDTFFTMVMTEAAMRARLLLMLLLLTSPRRQASGARIGRMWSNIWRQGQRRYVGTNNDRWHIHRDCHWDGAGCDRLRIMVRHYSYNTVRNTSARSLDDLPRCCCNTRKRISRDDTRCPHSTQWLTTYSYTIERNGIDQ